MTLPKILGKVSLDDIQNRPFVVIIAALMVLCGWAILSKDKASTKETEAWKSAATECVEKYDRLTTQLLIYADIIQEQRTIIDSAKTNSELEINKILK